MKHAITLSLLTTVMLHSSGTSIARAAEAKDVFEARVFRNAAGKQLNYRVLSPLDSVAGKTYPLVLFLHGLGERGADNTAQLKHAMNDFAKDDVRRQYPAFVAAPQCPGDAMWADFRRSMDDPDPEPFDSIKLVAELVDALPGELPIDKRRIYLTGLSMGGYGAWDLLRMFPDKFAAAAIVCGGGSERQAARFSKVPIWLFHGDQDEVVKPDVSRRMYAALRKSGGRPLYTEYVGVGHASWVPTYADPLLMTWLFAQELPR